MSQLDESAALAICQAAWPNATITPVAGNPNMLGWHLFTIAPSGGGALKVYITDFGEPIVMQKLVLVEPFKK